MSTVVTSFDLHNAADCLAKRDYTTHLAAINFLREQANSLHQKQPSSATKVRCIETGEVWKSQAVAADAIGVQPSRMSRHLNGQRFYETIGGKTYERVK